MDKRVLFLVPVGMALLALLLVWLGWVPGGSPGAPIDPSPGTRNSPSASPREDADAEPDAPLDADADPDRVLRDRVRTRARAQAGPDAPASADDESADDESDELLADPATMHSPLGYAHAYVLRHRDATHREKMRIVWPSIALEEAPPGAEVLLIEGYRNYSALLLTSNGRGATGSRVTIRERTRGDRVITSHAFDVSAADFDRVWHAARLIDGARAEHRARAPESGNGRIGLSSHAPHYWVRLRAGDGPLHESLTRHESFSAGIRNWREIQTRALYDLLAGLAPTDPSAGPLEAWRVPMTREIADVTPLRKAPDAGTRVRLAVALAVAAEVGGRDTLAALLALEASLLALESDDFGVTQTLARCRRATAVTRLRLDWSIETAVRTIRETGRDERWQKDLIQWTRARLRTEDASRYVEILRDDLAHPQSDAELLAETIAEVRRHFPGELGALLEPALGAANAAVRVSAALALLEAAPGDERALRVLDAVAADTGLHPSRTRTFQKTPRARAVDALVETGAWDTRRMRAQFASPSEDGRMLHRLELALAQAGDALSAVELRDAYRAALGGRPDRGLLTAIERLIELDDAPSFARIDALLTRYASPPEGEEDLLDRWARERIIPKLREALAEARGE